MKPWLWLPPRWAHDLSPLALRLIGIFSEGSPPAWRSLLWRGLVFKNPLGIAGGVDKNADHLRAWWNLGCGFVEIGTVTPRPQEPNPGVIMNRDLPSMSLWNRMGFPSEGADEVVANLRREKPFRSPVFVNIGKNRETPNESAVDDYLTLLNRFAGAADVFVVNISSPNTKGLRDLQDRNHLHNLLAPLVNRAREISTPLLVKLSPDLSDSSLEDAVDTAAEVGVDGFVLTNTTLSRPAGVPYPSEGGLSGTPLKELSIRSLKNTLRVLGPRRAGMLIISVGGVMTADDVFERLHLGADLVQIYSALVFEGPGIFRAIARQATGRS